VNAWIQQAIKVLEANGVPASELNANAIWIIIEHESSGNPNAINLTDSNAAAGDPSKGLMQTISTTFNEYALPGHGSIYNPVDNIIAGVRYAISRYGSLSNVPGVVAVNEGHAYVGY
jgi:SLT domain-containing protein